VARAGRRPYELEVVQSQAEPEVSPEVAGLDLRQLGRREGRVSLARDNVRSVTTRPSHLRHRRCLHGHDVRQSDRHHHPLHLSGRRRPIRGLHSHPRAVGQPKRSTASRASHGSLPGWPTSTVPTFDSS
jgi:hypothetical protein